MSRAASVHAAMLRAAQASDAASIAALVDREIARSSYADGVRYFLRAAVGGNRDDARAIIAEQDGESLGVVLFGDIAGAVGTARIHFIAVSQAARLHGIGRALCDAAVEQLAGHGARLVVAEVPEDAMLLGGGTLLSRCGFAEAGRVADYYRDGVGLVLLTRLVTPLP